MNTTSCHFRTIIFLGAVCMMRLEREYNHSQNGFNGNWSRQSFNRHKMPIRYSKRGLLSRKIGRK